jgi:hypothetical protein
MAVLPIVYESGGAKITDASRLSGGTFILARKNASCAGPVWTG